MSISPLSSMLTNPSARVPVALVLDVSLSMEEVVDGERRLDRLNQGLRNFFTETRRDMTARFAAEVAIFTFDGETRCHTPFSTVNDYSEFSQSVEIGGPTGTNIGLAVDTALNALDERTLLYQQNGISFHTPWLVVISDGLPTHGDLEAASEHCRLKERSGGLHVFPVSVCEIEAAAELAKLSAIRRPLFSKSANFASFFRFLSASMSSVSVSMPGDKLDLRPATRELEGWDII